MARTKKVKEEPKTYRIDRNFSIWYEAVEKKASVKDICEASEGKLTKSIVEKVLKTLKRYKTKKEAMSYFDLAMALKDYCVANSYDPDKYVISIANALYVKEIFSIAQLKKVKKADFEEIIEGKQMYITGKVGKEILTGYYNSLKKK